MSTRATVWIKSENEERFLYHHFDGYMLDEEICPILNELKPEEWTVDGVAESIIEKYDEYGKHKAYGVGWDSEYVYKIDVDKRIFEKFECGINDTEYGDRKEEKTQKKYLVKLNGYLQEFATEENHQPIFYVPCETDSQLRNGYLMGLASFMRNIHEKTLKRDFKLTDHEVNIVFEYMAQKDGNCTE